MSDIDVKRSLKMLVSGGHVPKETVRRVSNAALITVYELEAENEKLRREREELRMFLAEMRILINGKLK